MSNATTKNATHTPGPWARDEQPTGQYAEQVVAQSPRGKKTIVARIGSGYERREHDARLIAAAPELLGLARGYLAYLHADLHSGMGEDEFEAHPVVAAIRAAIKKATGE